MSTLLLSDIDSDAIWSFEIEHLLIENERTMDLCMIHEFTCQATFGVELLILVQRIKIDRRLQ